MITNLFHTTLGLWVQKLHLPHPDVLILKEGSKDCYMVGWSRGGHRVVTRFGPEGFLDTWWFDTHSSYEVWDTTEALDQLHAWKTADDFVEHHGLPYPMIVTRFNASVTQWGSRLEWENHSYGIDIEIDGEGFIQWALKRVNTPDGWMVGRDISSEEALHYVRAL